MRVCVDTSHAQGATCTPKRWENPAGTILLLPLDRLHGKGRAAVGGERASEREREQRQVFHSWGMGNPCCFVAGHATPPAPPSAGCHARTAHVTAICMVLEALDASCTDSQTTPGFQEAYGMHCICNCPGSGHGRLGCSGNTQMKKTLAPPGGHTAGLLGSVDTAGDRPAYPDVGVGG